MTIMTVLGTRPEIIRLSRVIPKLDSCVNHIVVHTGQNFDPLLSKIFFSELQLRSPNHNLGITSKSFGDQVGQLLKEGEKLLSKAKPDRLLVLGDTNSGLLSIVARRMGIPVFHMEAGNRCYDDRVPEEINRRIIDHSSNILMPYTQLSKENLIAEGIAARLIYVTGNPIFEVLKHYQGNIAQSNILNHLGLRTKEFFLVTLHRAENVDDKGRLARFLNAFKLVSTKYGKPVVVSTHPRTRERIKGLDIHARRDAIRFLKPFGLFDFITLEQNAFCVMTDSGTVQEECSIFRVPNVTIRDVTERPETIACGSNIITGSDPTDIVRCVEIASREAADWIPPVEYIEPNVSNKIVKILTGHYENL